MKTATYLGQQLKNVGLSWYVKECSGEWRWVASSFAAAKRVVKQMKIEGRIW